MPCVFLGLGSNIGNKEKNLQTAIALIADIPDCKIIAISPCYETSPVGGYPQDDFLNQVIEVTTALSPLKLLEHLVEIEQLFGRTHSERNAPRRLDIDVLLFDNAIIHNDTLTIPHPRMHERLFVLIPLADIAADVIHPIVNKTICNIRDDVIKKVGELQRIKLKS